MKPLKAICALLCLLLLASNVWSMLHWNEARGVFDDVCYLRQAHLCQRVALGGFDTDISRDDDSYLVSKLKAIGFPTPNDVTTAPCHTPISATGKMVIQYPPGTGALLALFPEGHQVVPLYVSASLVVFIFALAGIFAARTTLSATLPSTKRDSPRRPWVASATSPAPSSSASLRIATAGCSSRVTRVSTWKPSARKGAATPSR